MGALIVFYIVLVGLIIFLQWKVRLLRSGKIDIQTVHHVKSRKIRILRQTLAFFGHKLKNYLHKVFMQFAVWRMRVSAKAKRFIELRLPGLHMFFAKRPEFKDKHYKNFFWRGVVEYKYKMQRLKAQIREEEIQKSVADEPRETTPEIIVEAIEEAEAPKVELKEEKKPRRRRII
jgi:hypothetical protein